MAMKLEDFMTKSKNYHGENTFNYYMVNYNTCKDKFLITCNKGGHEIWHSTTTHFKSQPGCPICNRVFANIKRGKSNSLGLEEFKKRSFKLHGDKFDLSKVVYTNSISKVEVICKYHGSQWIEPRHHLKGLGCYRCGREETGRKAIKYKNVNELIAKLNEVHAEKYDYSLLLDKEYKTYEKIPVICKHHGVKEQLLATHLKGGGCNECRFFGYTKSDFLNYCENKKNI